MTQSTMLRTLLLATTLVAVFTVATGTSAEDPKDILFYGNSFTIAIESGSTRSVPNVLRDIAVAAGHPAPRNRNAAVNAQSLLWHLQHNTNVINTGIVAGESCSSCLGLGWVAGH